MTITRSQVSKTLKQLLEDFGENYVYPEWDRGPEGCRYIKHDGVTPACIVGHVLVRLGVAPYRFQHWEPQPSRVR